MERFHSMRSNTSRKRLCMLWEVTINISCSPPPLYYPFNFTNTIQPLVAFLPSLSLSLALTLSPDKWNARLKNTSRLTGSESDSTAECESCSIWMRKRRCVCVSMWAVRPFRGGTVSTDPDFVFVNYLLTLIPTAWSSILSTIQFQRIECRVSCDSVSFCRISRVAPHFVCGKIPHRTCTQFFEIFAFFGRTGTSQYWMWHFARDTLGPQFKSCTVRWHQQSWLFLLPHFFRFGLVWSRNSLPVVFPHKEHVVE